jgi:protein-tyrosine phosphatase
MNYINKVVYNVLCLTRNKNFLNFASKVSGIEDCNMIVPYIYLGNINYANNVDFLKKNNITAIVNCTENEAYNEYFDDKPKFRLKVNDSKEPDNINSFKSQILNAIVFIEKNREEKRNIYIHCYWGLMRSATVVAGYLIYKYGLSVNDAINIIKEQRPSALSSLYNFNEILYYLENKYVKVLSNKEDKN